MSGQDAEWAEPGLRQVMIQQIEDTYRTFGNPTQKPSTEVERHILEKAQSRDDYLQLGARLILHIKEIKSNQRQLQTPVSANSANSNNNMVLSQQAQIANVSIANNSNINQQLKLQQQQQQLVINQQNTNKHQQLLQQQQQQLLAKQIANANNTSNLTQTLNANQPLQAQIMLQRNLQTQQQASANSQQQLVTSQLSLQNQLGNMGLINVTSINMPLQNQVFVAASQQQQRQQVQQQLQLKQQLQQQQNLLHQQQQQQQQVKQTAEQEQLQLLKQLQNKQQLINQGASLQNANTGNTRLEFSPMLNKSNVPKQQTSNMMQASPAKNVPAPSPQPQPSPQMQPTPSPAFINPPSVGPAQSPSTNNDAYVDKLKEMSKYIDPLAKLISRMPKDEGRADHVKERNKMNGLLDMLTNRNRRVTLPVLSKCENVLKKLFPDATLTSVSTATPDTSTVDSIPTPVAKPHSALQPVGEVVTNVITSANIMSDTQQNILPGMLALNAPMITPPLPPCRKFRKRKLPEGGEKKPTLPRPLQMEIVSLCNRFDISVDRSKPFDSAGFTMNCRLKDDSVSSKLSTISVAMRPDYPISEPVYFLSDTHDNISSIRRLLGKQLSKTSDRITFTQILNRWEMCVYDVLDE